jgi:hypothetical protein
MKKFVNKDIQIATPDGPIWVAAKVAGVWASVKLVGGFCYSVTHVPTGLSVMYSVSREECEVLVRMLDGSFPNFRVDAEFGKPVADRSALEEMVTQHHKGYVGKVERSVFCTLVDGRDVYLYRPPRRIDDVATPRGYPELDWPEEKVEHCTLAAGRRVVMDGDVDRPTLFAQRCGVGWARVRFSTPTESHRGRYHCRSFRAKSAAVRGE